MTNSKYDVRVRIRDFNLPRLLMSTDYSKTIRNPVC